MATPKPDEKPWYTFPWLRTRPRKLFKSKKSSKEKDPQPTLPPTNQVVASGTHAGSNEKSPAVVDNVVPSTSTTPLPISEAHTKTTAPPAEDSLNDGHPALNITGQNHMHDSMSPGSENKETGPPDAVVCSSGPACTTAYFPKINMPKDRDVVTMVVMGPTGVGKTTFINSFKDVFSLGEAGHHDLDAGTKKMETITVNLQETGKSLVLVDTPGFDDPLRSNAQILSCIAEYLEDMYRKKQLLDGIIYLHRITDIRLDAGASEALNIFKRMYGNEGYDKIGLVTTMWNDIVPGMKQKYELKEQELMGAAWAPFLMRDKGKAHVSRYDATSDETTKLSALDIVTGIMENSVPQELRLRIQRELVDEQKKLPRTEAGKAAFTLAETAKYYLNELAS